MSYPRSVLLREGDRDRIQALLHSTDPTQGSLLFAEIDSASILPDHLVPKDVVKMHSIITFTDIGTGIDSTIELVYPEAADAAAGRISILAPIGAALIGLRVGERIEWPLPNNQRRGLEVISVRDSL